jgi:hypothetical protein
VPAAAVGPDREWWLIASTCRVLAIGPHDRRELLRSYTQTVEGG